MVGEDYSTLEPQFSPEHRKKVESVKYKTRSELLKDRKNKDVKQMAKQRDAYESETLRMLQE